MKNITILIIILTLTSSCASLKDSMITGTTIGAAAGGLLGNANGTGSQRNRNTNKGLLIGAALGAGFGYLAHQEHLKEKKLEVENVLSHEKNEVPLLTRPRIKRVWVEDKVQGKRFIRGHWEYVIEKQSQWSSK